MEALGIYRGLCFDDPLTITKLCKSSLFTTINVNNLHEPRLKFLGPTISTQGENSCLTVLIRVCLCQLTTWRSLASLQNTSGS